MAIKINGEIYSFLYEKIKQAQAVGLTLPEIDEEVISNLNPNKPLRYYQIDALKYTNHYIKNLLKNEQLHLLYHMATGSGKTIIMAALILYFYKKGYNTFIFFVNNANIIEKTKDNFLEKESSKYLFANDIILNGEKVEIKEISGFDEISDKNINILFTTVQSLHDNLKLTKENQISLEDFENNKVILLADEAHHLNAEAKKKKSKDEDDEIFTWEYTINQILASNKESALLEFTATPDFRDETVIKKYLDKVIYNYDLLEFRKDGYTKNFDNYQSSHDDIHRTLLAMLMSQYRKKLFAKKKIDVKPVILAKAKTTAERDDFIKRFLEFIDHQITKEDIIQLEENVEGYAKEMFKFYKNENISYNDLIAEFKLDFDKEHIITLDSKMPTKELQEKNRLVNNLESLDNPYRLIIVVDMLNEGWDVLNLYDIVRLYEERDSRGTKIGRSTIQEAQLIGRGVRYYPFEFEEKHKEYYNKRKYDNDIENEYRFCETLLFYSKTDSKYLYELKEALKQQGMDIDDKTKFDYILKDSFKMSDIYNNGFIFVNEQKEIKNEANKVPKNFRFLLERNYVKNDIQSSLIDNSKIDESTEETHIKNITLKEYAEKNYSLVYKAMRKEFIPFNILKKYIPTIKSHKEFLMNPDYIADFGITIISKKEEPTNKEYYLTFADFFYKLRKKFEAWKETKQGTYEFNQIPIKSFIRDTHREKIHPDKYGEGISQNAPGMDENYKLDLSQCDWFVYTDNFGTTEEKSFVKKFANIVEEIKREYEEVYLIRNERNVHIFSFAEGGRFEPDFILLLKRNNQKGSEIKQIFIEAKGEFLQNTDEWKEIFLKDIHEKSIINIYEYQSNNNYSIHGIPFYNENKVDEFYKSIRETVNLETKQNVKVNSDI